MEDGYTIKPQFDRVFFIVDRSRLKDEKDELKNAIVVYIPEKDLSKPSVEQRCSQLVGISILINCFTGNLPKFIRLKNNGFAIRLLGSDLIMGLQTKFDEPKWCVYQIINRIHDFFTFYYSSPTLVMQMACEDWEIYTTQMSAIFHCIIEFTLKENRSLPSMFSHLPYVSLDPDKGGTQLYVKAQRLLRLCQLNEAVIGGCMFYDGELLCSQLPPDMGEKLLLAASGGVELNSRSILEDQLAPEAVWIINVFLTSEQLALSRHLRRRTKPLQSMYTKHLKPNPNLESEIQEQQRYENADIEKPSVSDRQRKTEKNGMKIKERLSNYQSEDFVTISYGSDSVSFTKKTTVNFLKRSKTDRRQSILNNNTESLSSSQRGRGIFDPLPPTPDKSSMRLPPPIPPPLIPPRTYNIGGSLPPVPDRKRLTETRLPKLPPRKGKDQPPEPPPRVSVKYKQGTNPVKPPSPPPRLKQDTTPVQENVREEGMSHVGEEGVLHVGEEGVSQQFEEDSELSSPGIYGTPRSFDVHMRDELIQYEGESDQSEGYRTPSPASPLPNRDVSLSDSSWVPSNGSYLTPVSTSPNEECDQSLVSGDNTSACDGIDVTDDGLQRKIATNKVFDENHYEFDQEPYHDTERTKKISTSSDRSDGSSLIITQAVSEVWSEGSLTPEQERKQNTIIKRSETSKDSPSHSPSPKELMESISEDDDDSDVRTLQRERFRTTLTQTRLDKWGGSLMSPKHYKTEINSKPGEPDLVMHKKCLYIQKCVNTVVAILADEDLTEKSDLIKNLWTTLLSWIVVLNNNVEPSLKDQDSIYSSSDGVRQDSSFKSYHAGFSTNIAMCEVSSVTAPYQFRHAVRRVHQEYSHDPTLRQVSLSKEHCRMISQNVLGREVYYHSNRVGSNDALLSHSLIEKQVKAASKQKFVSDAYTVNFL